MEYIRKEKRSYGFHYMCDALDRGVSGSSEIGFKLTLAGVGGRSGLWLYNTTLRGLDGDIAKLLNLSEEEIFERIDNNIEHIRKLNFEERPSGHDSWYQSAINDCLRTVEGYHHVLRCKHGLPRKGLK